MHFGGNPLLPDSIGFSPLLPGHPNGLGQYRYRASRQLSLPFTLPRSRSSGFGYCSSDYGPFQTQPYGSRFRYGSGLHALSLATTANSLPSFSKLTTAAKWLLRHSTNCPTVVAWFQALFTPFDGHFSAFPHSTSALSDSGSV